MIHPLFTTLATRPQLLLEHLGAYAELAAVEAGQTVGLLRQRVLLGAIAAIGALLGLILAGGALLVLAAVPLQQMPMPWLLLLVPGLPLLLALLCWWRMRQHSFALSFELLRHQLEQDGALLREAGEH
jgi:uncharacterized membrane protein YqjE